VLLLGERESGEGYAPDEIAALAEFARGAGSALDALGDGRAVDGTDRVIAAIDALRASIEQRLPQPD
jgi:hypothetical protein